MSTQILHLEFDDGSVEHAIFDRQTWNFWIADPAVKSCWTHESDDCHWPPSRFWSMLRDEGYPMSATRHALADMDDPTWSGDRGAVLLPVNVAIDWPPTSPLYPWMLSELAGISRGEAAMILGPLTPTKITPAPTITGQLRLF